MPPVLNDRIGDQDLLSTVLQSDIEKIRLTLEELDRDYAVPNAFQAFQPAVEGRLKGEGEEPWQSCISGME